MNQNENQEKEQQSVTVPFGDSEVMLTKEELISAAALGLCTLASEQQRKEDDSKEMQKEEEEKLKGIEERLLALEQNYLNKSKSMGSARGSAETGLGELETVYASVFGR